MTTRASEKWVRQEMVLGPIVQEMALNLRRCQCDLLGSSLMRVKHIIFSTKQVNYMLSCASLVLVRSQMTNTF